MSAGTAIILTTREARKAHALDNQAEVAALLKGQGLALEVKNDGEHWIVREGKRIVVQWWPSTAKITPGETWKKSQKRGTVEEFVAFVGQTLREERDHPPTILPENRDKLRPIKHRGQVPGYVRNLGHAWQPLDARRKPLGEPVRKLADAAKVVCDVAASPPCSKCQVRPATPCRYCTVVLCNTCGDEHTPPDCPPQWEEYLQSMVSGELRPSSPDQIGRIREHFGVPVEGVPSMVVAAPWDYSQPPAPEEAVENLPTPEGRRLGGMLARLADRAEAEQLRQFPDMIPRCNDCAFRAGTRPNGCEETLLDALKCVVENRPFYCHKGTQDGAKTPTRLCSGAMVLYGSDAGERLRVAVRIAAEIQGQAPPCEPQPELDAALHPTGRCTCGDTGACDWCRGMQERLDDEPAPSHTDLMVTPEAISELLDGDPLTPAAQAYLDVHLAGPREGETEDAWRERLDVLWRALSVDDIAAAEAALERAGKLPPTVGAEELDDGPVVCGGCLAVGPEPHAADCIDERIRIDQEDRRERGEFYDPTDDLGDEE